MNLYNKDRNETKYFDKKVSEEDCPVEVEAELQDYYAELDKTYETFFEENFLLTAKQQSKDEREKKKLNDSSFVYGEITFRSFSYIFEYIKDIYGKDAILPGSFIDLGSGVGKGLVAASFLHSFQKLIGIEYLENLHNLALNIKAIYDENFEKLLHNNQQFIKNVSQKSDFEVYNGNFLQYDWSEASFLFANSTCFSLELMNSLSQKAEQLKKGTIFVTFTKKLPNLSENWEIRDGFRRVMSWGIATIYVHRKLY